MNLSEASVKIPEKELQSEATYANVLKSNVQKEFHNKRQQKNQEGWLISPSQSWNKFIMQ